MAPSAGKTHKATFAKTTKEKALEKEAPLLVPEIIEQNDHEGDSGISKSIEGTSKEEVSVGIESGELLAFTRGKDLMVFDPKNEGLRPSWFRFIDAYFNSNFNGTEAYMVAFPNCKKRTTAGVEACKLLKVPSIVDEIRYRLDTQRCTDEYVISRLMHQSQFVDSFRINAAVAATATLAKVRGLLQDTKKPAFSNDNPAVFMAPISDKEMADMKERRSKMGRIVE